jgi:NAD(P)-dependent dehydrogenase (short-subunit alcohol dehydrogenase family)
MTLTLKPFRQVALLAAILLAAPLQAAFPDPDQPTVLITGANASHGLAFVEEYNKLGWNIIASCRSPEKADALNAMAASNPNIVVEELDIIDDAEIAALAESMPIALV